MRVILHCDMNNFYASVECLYEPSLRGKPVAVVGDPALRHGIVLAKNYLAKAAGVRTGEALWQARQKCADIVFVPPHYDRYLTISALARDIFGEYTDQVEPFGLDECWLDVTGSTRLFGSGRCIADELRRRIRYELGITASVGVSYNKVFAKLGSDYRKPDATTEITTANYREIVWPLPAEDLLNVGRATGRRLAWYGIRTIGDLARRDPAFLQAVLGKNGLMLWGFANGYDTAPVAVVGAVPPLKSIGNSTTTPRDLTAIDEVRVTLYALADSVAARLREQRLKCRTVCLHVRDKDLESVVRQAPLPEPSCLSSELAEAGCALFRKQYALPFAVRSIGLQAARLAPAGCEQLSLLPDEAARQRRETLEYTIDDIRRRYGYYAVRRGLLLTDEALSIDAKGDHVIHPLSYVRPS